MKFFKKLKKGFTLAETLIAVAVLAIVSALTVTVSVSTLGTKNTMMRVGQSSTLASSAVTTIADEIRYGQNIREVEVGEGTTLLFDSTSFGADTSFVVTEGRVCAKNNAGSYELLPAKYYGGLKVGSLTLEKVETPTGDVHIGVKISISIESGGDVVYATEMTVPALNGIR